MKFDVFVHFNAYFGCSVFLQVVQKQTLGEVGTLTVIWWPVVSGIFIQKNYQNLIIFLQVMISNVGDPFLGHCIPTATAHLEVQHNKE